MNELHDFKTKTMKIHCLVNEMHDFSSKKFEPPCEITCFMQPMWVQISLQYDQHLYWTLLVLAGPVGVVGCFQELAGWIRGSSTFFHQLSVTGKSMSTC